MTDLKSFGGCGEIGKGRGKKGGDGDVCVLQEGKGDREVDVCVFSRGEDGMDACVLREETGKITGDFE